MTFMFMSTYSMRGSRRGEAGVQTSPGKSQVAIDLHRYTGTDPIDKQFDPSDGSTCYSREARTALCGKKLITEKQCCQDPPGGTIWIRACTPA